MPLTEAGLITASWVCGAGAILCALAMLPGAPFSGPPVGLLFILAGVLIGAPCAIAKGATMSRRRDARDAAAAVARGDAVPGVPSLVLGTAPGPEKVIGVVTTEGNLGLVETAYAGSPIVTDLGNARALEAAVIRDQEVKELADAYSKPALKKMAAEEGATYSRRGSSQHIAREILENRDAMTRELGEGDADPKGRTF